MRIFWLPQSKQNKLQKTLTSWTVTAPLKSLGKSGVQSTGPWAWTSVREWTGCMPAPHPSYDSSCGSVMCFLTWGWAGWSAGTSRTGPWALGCPSGAKQDYRLKPFHLTRQNTAIVCYHCCLNGPSGCSCAQFIILLATQVFSCVYVIICFIFGVIFGNSLDKALLGYQHDLVCLFSSEAEGAVGLEPGEHFNYNHSITTLCFKVREVDGREGSGGETHAHNNTQWSFHSLLFHITPDVRFSVAQESLRIT